MCPLKKSKFFLFFYLHLLLITHGVFVNDMYSLTVTRWSCEDSDPRLVHNVTCFTKLESRTVRSHYLFLNMLPNVTLNEVFVHIRVYKKFNTVYRPFLINAEENICGFLRGKANAVLTQIIWEELIRRSNIGHPCPYSGSVNISGLVFNDSALPPVLPEGQFRLHAHVCNGVQRISVVNVKVLIDIKPKGAANLKF